ncbi:MAG: hypothetical protein IT431_07910 [Phycisphaerales bacterium]|nr:hypothetical protein [Phycisphaerales bacterium]
MPKYRNRGDFSRRGSVLQGCLVALGILVLLLVIGGVVVALNWRGWTAGLMEQGITAAIDEADVSAEDAAAMKLEVATLMQDFKDKKVSVEDLAHVVEEVAQSPVMTAASVMFVDKSYVQASALTVEEKAEGTTQISRFMRGLFSEQISKTKIDDVTSPIHYQASTDKQPPVQINANNLNMQLKSPEDVTPEQLKEFLANCKTAADEAGIPPERYEVDMAREFSAAIDRALGRAPALPPAEGGPGGEAGEDAPGGG